MVFFPVTFQTFGPSFVYFSNRRENKPDWTGWMQQWTRGKKPSIWFLCRILTSTTTVLTQFMVVAGLRVMSCTNQLGCLVQWRRRSNPINREDTPGAQGPSDSTRLRATSELCFQLMKQQSISKWVENFKMCYTWSFVWSRAVSNGTNFSVTIFPVVNSWRALQSQWPTLLLPQIILLFVAVHSTAAILQDRLVSLRPKVGFYPSLAFKIHTKTKECR